MCVQDRTHTMDAKREREGVSTAHPNSTGDRGGRGREGVGK